MTIKNDSPAVNRALILTMAVGCGVSVANLYYSQPLLAEIEREFHASVREVSFIPMLTQLGYAAGMLLFVPLGDMLERRKVIILMLVAVACALVAAALAANLVWLIAAGLLIGITTIVPQLIVPFAATLAKPAARGRVVGTVMSGLLVGSLLARTVSGFVGAHFGWREMYWIAAALMLTLACVMALLLPQSKPSFNGSYRQLMRSLVDLARTQPVLREAAVTGALLFAAFSVFWTTLVFLLEQPPYRYASQAAGLFGLVGAAGALGASIAGRLADRITPRRIVTLALAVTMLSFVVLWGLGYHLFGLMLGVLLLDLGVQGGHVSNQTRIYNLSSQAHNRVNTIYMVTYFLGGAVGSSLGAWSWSVWRWSGVCAAGLSMLALAFAVHFFTGRKRTVMGAQLDSIEVEKAVSPS